MAVLSSMVSLHSDGSSRHRSYAVTLTATSFVKYGTFRTLSHVLEEGQRGYEWDLQSGSTFP